MRRDDAGPANVETEYSIFVSYIDKDDSMIQDKLKRKVMQDLRQPHNGRRAHQAIREFHFLHLFCSKTTKKAGRTDG